MSAEHLQRPTPTHDGPPRVVVVGIGNPYRGDDGVGHTAATRLRSLLPANVPVHAIRGGVSALLDAWENADAAVLIDAVQSGAPPGTVRRLDVGAHPLPRDVGTTSTHGLSLPEVIELARTLDVLPPQVVLFGVEAGRIDHSHDLSPEVAAATDELLDAVVAEVNSLASTFPGML